MKRLIFAVLCLLAGTGAIKAQPVSVIYETDYGNDADDALALEFICKYNDLGKMKLLGVGTHKEGPNICAAVDGSLNWYGYPKVPVAKSPTPVPRPNDGRHYADSVALCRNSKGKIAFKPTKNGKYENAVDFYRRILAKQPDNSVTIVSVGFATNLALLLDSKPDKFSPLSGRELVAKKVKLLSTMMGCYRENPFSEYNVNCDIPAMQKVMREWPGEIVQNPFEIGEKVRYPLSLMHEKLAWTTPHPLNVATSVNVPDPNGEQCEFDVMSAIYLVHPELFNLSERGTISIDDNGFNHFTPSPNGKHRYLTTTPAQDKTLRELLIKVTTMKPKKFKK